MPEPIMADALTVPATPIPKASRAGNRSVRMAIVSGMVWPWREWFGSWRGSRRCRRGRRLWPSMRLLERQRQAKLAPAPVSPTRNGAGPLESATRQRHQLVTVGFAGHRRPLFGRGTDRPQKRAVLIRGGFYPPRPLMGDLRTLPENRAPRRFTGRADRLSRRSA